LQSVKFFPVIYHQQMYKNCFKSGRLYLRY